VGVSSCASDLGSVPKPSGEANSTLVDMPGEIYYTQVSSYVEVLPTASEAISLYRSEEGSTFLNCLRQTNESTLKQRGLTVSSSKGDFLPNTSIRDQRFTDETVFTLTSSGQTSKMTEDLVIAHKGRVVVICAFISLDPPFPADLDEHLLSNINKRL